jgi:hypothetical protein
MSSDRESSKWIPVEEYALESEMLPSELVSMIVDGELPGERRGNRWFVAAPLVVLIPGGAADGADLLRISACCLGSYVTAGRGELGIPLRFSDPGWPAALAAVNAGMGAPPAELPVEIWLNGEHFLVDSSLWVDFGAALVEFETLVDPTIEGPL